MSTGSPAHSLLTRPLSARPARPRLHSAISPETQPGACSQASVIAPVTFMYLVPKCRHLFPKRKRLKLITSGISRRVPNAPNGDIVCLDFQNFHGEDAIGPPRPSLPPPSPAQERASGTSAHATSPGLLSQTKSSVSKIISTVRLKWNPKFTMFFRQEQHTYSRNSVFIRSNNSVEEDRLVKLHCNLHYPCHSNIAEV